MFMRFRGGGVGHKATNTSTQNFQSQAAASDSNHGDNFDDVVPEHQPSDPDDVQDGEEGDYGYMIASDSEAEGGDSEDDDLGAEDGEEPWEMGDLQAEGFDDL
jgi:hypothetical protein